MQNLHFVAHENQLVIEALGVKEVKETHDLLSEMGFKRCITHTPDTPASPSTWRAPIPDTIEQVQKYLEIFAFQCKMKLSTHIQYATWIKKADISYRAQPNIQRDIQPLKLPYKDYQEEAICTFLTRKKLGLAFEMGLGKTVIAFGCILNVISTTSVSQVLYVLPKVLRPNVFAECERFTNLSIQILKNGKMPIDPNASIVLCSYGLLKNIQHHPWKFIIADECHFLKNSKSKRSKLFFKLSQKADYILLLTGTPAHKTSEYWHSLHILDPVIFSEFYTNAPPKAFVVPKISHKKFYFADRYSHVEPKRIFGGRCIYDFKKSQYIEELHSLLRPYWIMKRLEDVITLPPLVIEKYSIGNVPDKEAKHFQKEMERIKLLPNKHESEQLLNQLIVQTSQFKQSYVWDYLVHIFESYHDKIILFFYYKHMGHYLKEQCDKVGKSYIYIDGDIHPDSKRYELIHHFQSVESCQVAFLSLAVCATGFNLAFVNLALVADITFHSDYHEQSQGRCHRIGQLKKCVMQYLILDKTTDPCMWMNLQSKLQVGHRLLH
jgi:SNF2 family DNA or RNA helicase